MFMILMHHLVVHNSFNVTNLPIGFDRFVLEVLFYGSGKVGVVIFFSISAWYLMDREQTLRSSLRRLWILDGQLLFYSLSLTVLFALFDRADLTLLDVVKSVLPLTMGRWWYMRSYAGFLLLLPFLREGLYRLSDRQHLLLALVVAVVWGGLPLLPESRITLESTFGFVVLAIILSAYKWRIMPHQQLSGRALAAMVGLGYGIIVCCWLVTCLLQLTLGVRTGTWAAMTISLPSMLAGFGLFLLFERMEFRNRAVNAVAGCAVAVYLITEYMPMIHLLWEKTFDLGVLMSQPLPLLRCLGILAAIFCVCCAVEAVRSWVFRALSHHERGYWYEKVYGAAAKRLLTLDV